MQQPRRLQLVPAPAGGGARRVARFAAQELAIWAGLYGVYLAVRGVAIGEPDDAVAHASDVVSVEKAVGVFHEVQLQQALLPVADFFSAYYMLCFGPLIASVVVWLALKQPVLYRQLRNALLLSIALATVVFVVFPCAPPRLLPGMGIQDTVGLSSHDTGSFMGIRFNPYAAVPSMHVGWSLIVAWFGFRAARRRWLKGFFAVHPVLMALTVTGTGNHYFLDSAAGIAVAVLAMALLSRFPRRRRPLRLVSAPAEEPVRPPLRRAA
jgi:membrane-associated phospholipid phosphatase